MDGVPFHRVAVAFAATLIVAIAGGQTLRDAIEF